MPIKIHFTRILILPLPSFLHFSYAQLVKWIMLPSSTARLFSLPFGNVPLLPGGDTQWKGKWLVSGWARSQEVSPHVLHHPLSEPCTCSSHPKVLWVTAWLTLQECSGRVSGPRVALFSPAVPFMPQNKVWKEILNENAPLSLPVHPSFFTSSPQALSLAHSQVAQYNSKMWAIS